MRCPSYIFHISTKYAGRRNRVRLLRTSLKLHVETRVAGRYMRNVLLMFKFINMFTDKRKGKEKIDPLSN